MRDSIKQNVRFSFFKRQAVFALLSVFFLGALAAPVSAAESPKVKEAMQFLRDETSALGKPKLENGDLFFGSTKMNGNVAIVDAIKDKYAGTATLFAKNGANFVRVTTNVIKDGQRAVGTNLDPSGPAMAAIKQGTPFYGMVDILGKIYDTGYEPIKAENGETVGVYYVGFVME